MVESQTGGRRLKAAEGVPADCVDMVFTLASKLKQTLIPVGIGGYQRYIIVDGETLRII